MERIRVLLVDDDPEIVDCLAEALTSQGFNVYGVTSLAKALEWLEQNTVDLVITDSQGMLKDRNDLLPMMEEIRRITAVPVILMTDAIKENQIPEFLQQGFAAVLIKVATLKDLYEAIRKPFRTKFTVLVVNDCQTALETTAELIETFGYSAATAKDGQEAWEMVKKNPPNLVFTSDSMPRLSGPVLLEKMKASADDTISDIPVILYGTWATVNEIRLREQGFAVVLQKPAKAETIKDALISVLGC